LANIVRLLITGLVLGIVVFLARKGEAYFEGFVGGMIPEQLAGFRLPLLIFIILLIVFGGKIHKLIPEAGMVLLAVYFADLIEAKFGGEA